MLAQLNALIGKRFVIDTPYAQLSHFPRYLNAIDTVRSEMAVPLLFQNKVVGVLDIQSTQVDYFTHQQQEILVLLGSRLAVAIENARLFERARGQAEIRPVRARSRLRRARSRRAGAAARTPARSASRGSRRSPAPASRPARRR